MGFGLSDNLTVSLGGLFIALVVGIAGTIFLFKQKVVFNEQNEETSIELPFFGKLKTNSPAMAALFISAALAAFVLYNWRQAPGLPELIPITTSVTIEAPEALTQPLLVLGVIPQSSMRVHTIGPADKSVSVTIPVLKGEHSYSGLAQLRADGLSAVMMGSAIPGDDGNLLFKAAFPRLDGPGGVEP